MDLKKQKDVNPFHSLAIVHKLLIICGFMKLLKKPKYKFVYNLFQVYRVCVFVFLVLYNLLHIIFIYQVHHKSDELLDGLLIAFPQANVLSKFLSLNMNSARVEKINNLMRGHDTLFAARTKKDEEIIMKNNKAMHRLVKAFMYTICMSNGSWIASHFMSRLRDDAAIVPVYMPFKVETWTQFTWSVMIESVFPLLWIGYGHLTLDMTIATYYANSRTQLKIIKYNLEHLFDRNVPLNMSASHSYVDEVDTTVRERFIHYVQRYDMVVWYTRQVDRVFKGAMIFQILSSCVVYCITVIKISQSDARKDSAALIFLLLFFVVMLSQVFVYCYYGGLVEYESKLLNDSLYLSDWTSASPAFRRMLLTAMCRWLRPLTPRAAHSIPLSLTTFFMIMRSAYSLYTVLVSTAQKG